MSQHFLMTKVTKNKKPPCLLRKWAKRTPSGYCSTRCRSDMIIVKWNVNAACALFVKCCVLKAKCFFYMLYIIHFGQITRYRVLFFSPVFSIILSSVPFNKSRLAVAVEISLKISMYSLRENSDLFN